MNKVKKILLSFACSVRRFCKYNALVPLAYDQTGRFGHVEGV